MDFEGGMGIDTLEDINEVHIGVDPLQATRRDQALHDPDVARPDFR
jgi:hypothetical protein